MGKVYLNGNFVEEDEALVPVSDRGFLYGDGLFETMRAYDGRVFRLDDHVRRLFNSAGALRIPIAVTPEDLAAAVTELVVMNGLSGAYVRITLTRGLHPGKLVLDTGETPTLVINAREYEGYPAELYERGMRLTAAQTVRHTHSAIGRHKTLNYLESLIARDAANAAGFEEALFFDESGCITECASSNIFFVMGNDLHTPAADMNLLPGITRGVVMELARWNGRKVLERKWHLRELLRADEAFLTNSLMGIMPVCEAMGTVIGLGAPGEVTRALIGDYRRLVNEECGGET